MGELTDYLNKEHESSFSFNKSMNSLDESIEKSQKQKKSKVFLGLQNFNVKMQKIFEMKSLDFRKTAFLKIYQKMERIQTKFSKVHYNKTNENYLFNDSSENAKTKKFYQNVSKPL